MGKKKHLMTFTRPAALRKIEQIPGILEKQGPMSKHQLAKRLGVVPRTAQTYLAELKRRNLIHVSLYVVRTGGGIPVSVWASGPEPEGYVVPVQPAPTKPKAPRVRRTSRSSASKRPGVSVEQVIASCPWHRYFWNMVNVSSKETE